MTCLLSKWWNTDISFYSTSTLLTLKTLTVETPKMDGSIPFSDTLLSSGPCKSLLTTVYRKPIHTDYYHHWKSYHNLSAEYSVFNTLTHKPRTFCAKPQLLHKEEEHIKGALLRCKYPSWTLNRLKKKSNRKYYTTQDHINISNNNTNNNNCNNNHSNIHMVPYTKVYMKVSRTFVV